MILSRCDIKYNSVIERSIMNNDSQKRAEMKQKRLKQAFIDTTKKMIMEKGHENVSVRKIADNTGYTCATLYHHFKNAEELLWYTREDVVNDVVGYLLEKTRELDSSQVIKGTFKAYIDYCVDNPNAFKFFFLYQQSSTKSDFSDIESMNSLIGIFSKAFGEIGKKYNLDINTVMRKSNVIFYSIHGMLTVYLSKNYGLSNETLYQGLDDALEFILSEEN